MIHKTLSPKLNHVRVTFELPSCIWADRIFLVGDFNQWSSTATPMCQERDGVWRVTLDLPRGSRHEYRYLIDGHWKTDWHADGFAMNVHGTENSVVCAMLPDSALLERGASPMWDGRLMRPALNTPLPAATQRSMPMGERARRIVAKQPKAA